MAVARVVPDVEIVSVDSMQVYRGMDIGTAKPTPAEQREIPHHLIDVADPSEDYTVVAFRGSADAALADIAATRAPRRCSSAAPASTSGRWSIVSNHRGSGR